MVEASCFYHLRRIRQIRRRAGKEVTTQLVIASITSRPDYCNSVLAGLPQATLVLLQSVQNAAVLLILELSMRDHVTQGLLQLHWSQIRYRIQFKLCSIIHSIQSWDHRCFSSTFHLSATSSRATESVIINTFASALHTWQTVSEL
jgi:hypothetical protein